MAYIKKATMGMDKFNIAILDAYTTNPIYEIRDSHNEAVVDMFW